MSKVTIETRDDNGEQVTTRASGAIEDAIIAALQDHPIEFRHAKILAGIIGTAFFNCYLDDDRRDYPELAEHIDAIQAHAMRIEMFFEKREHPPAE
jgi:hypothetical protein